MKTIPYRSSESTGMLYAGGQVLPALGPRDALAKRAPNVHVN